MNDKLEKTANEIRALIKKRVPYNSKVDRAGQKWVREADFLRLNSMVNEELQKILDGMK